MTFSAFKQGLHWTMIKAEAEVMRLALDLEEAQHTEIIGYCAMLIMENGSVAFVLSSDERNKERSKEIMGTIIEATKAPKVQALMDGNFYKLSRKDE